MRPWTSLATTTSLTARPGALAVALHLDGRELDDLRSSPASARTHGRLELVGLGGREKADAAEVDGEDGDAAARHGLQGAQDGAVATEHDHEVGLRHLGLRQQLDARLGGQARDAPLRVAGGPAGAQDGTAHCHALRRRHRAAAEARSAGALDGLGVVARDDVEEELAVAGRAGMAALAGAEHDAARLARRPRRRAPAPRCEWPGSRTTPRRTSLRPASNCGFTSGSTR